MFGGINSPFIQNDINSFLEVECICDDKNYLSKTQLIQCFLCQKYQHLSCIFQARYIKPYICFNCQFKYNHFYLRWRKTVLPAKEIIYSKKWVKDQILLNKGTKVFKFPFNISELYRLNVDKNYPHYLAFIWMTNNGKAFNFGFPDNINIKINGKDFYSTETKGFKYPLLLSLENSYDYTPKKKHLITMEDYEIPNASEFFCFSKSNRLHNQIITVSFEHPLENYYGSEFQYEDTRRYLFYIGIFQEIKIPQISLIKNANKLYELNNIFRNMYQEKVMRIKWDKISKNIITTENEEMNMNLISHISYQKIIYPVRGIMCQHSEVLDFGECCKYITSKNQIYKCYKCNKPLNIMYIDDKSEKLFEIYKSKDFEEIYFNKDFKFIKGEKENNNNDILSINNNNINEGDSLSDSFFEYHKNEFNSNKNEIYEINDSSSENNEKINNNNIIELDETISLNSDSNDNEISLIDNNEKSDKYNINKNNLQLNNKINKLPKKINNLDKNKLIDLRIEMNFNKIKERIKKEMIQRKMKNPEKYENIKINNQLIKTKENNNKEEIIIIGNSNNESSNYIPIDNEFGHFSTNSN